MSYETLTCAPRATSQSSPFRSVDPLNTVVITRSGLPARHSASSGAANSRSPCHRTKAHSKSAEKQASPLLGKVGIQQAIAERATSDPAVWTLRERQQFWTAVASGTVRFIARLAAGRCRPARRAASDARTRADQDAGVAWMVRRVTDVPLAKARAGIFFHSVRRRAAAPEFDEHGKAASDEQHRRGLGNDGGIFNEEVFEPLERPAGAGRRNGLCPQRQRREATSRQRASW